MIDARVMQIADSAVAGSRPTYDDIMFLLGFDPYSVEASYVVARARAFGMDACGGIGLIEAQIGVDSHPCPENCLYCSFAMANVHAVEHEALEVPLSVIVDYARLFDDLGVHLISLMATASLPFERYLDIVAAVRGAVSPEMPLLANTRDITLDEARALKDAGASAAYHALRLGEGRITSIDPDRRRQTMRNIRAAGLPLMTGIDPLWSEVSHEELASRICEIPRLDSYSTGACGLHAFSGSSLEGCTPATRGYIRYVGALVRLTCGDAVRFGGVGGAVWVDAGCDARARGKGSSRDWLAREVHQARRQLASDGWRVPDRPTMEIFG